ncbi:NAD(P)-dependent oxidoreductase [Aspergillus mulundensis]|uniref:Putative NAD binding NADP oxidoreductase coenzyme F420-dependent n=1 Tax=Aspergillus mulundensis TaxID=1810919 RepID=A0A3D8QMM5_9EURO|nr:putative NAD binding NADP oxidoreductase coenzyme F420-dependent [Aspergillus mulundensis]RDW62948.1 putative NAD binding NADP oxidoreductase coenzyme F420-dependent [Aspergillus mulundensis]
MKIGFIGLGVMGTPMALNLSRRFPLTVWNRTASKYPPFRQAGAMVAETPQELAESSEVIFTMLFNDTSFESILTSSFKNALRGKILVNTSSVSVEYSRYLAEEAQKSGARFIEMPVSGSKVPAEQGQLVGMVAGDEVVANQVKSIVQPAMVKEAIYCGSIGSGLKTKYAVNLYLITMSAGLAESMALARAQGLNIKAFGQVLDAGPMASAYSKLKIAKMISRDYSPQAAVKDCYNLTQLITSAAQDVDAETPLIQLSASLYHKALTQQLGDLDMIALEKILGNSMAEEPGMRA